MDVVGRVKEITEHISAETKARKDKVAADAKDAIRRLAKCVKDLVERAERGSLTKVDEDLDGLAADVTRKMGRIALVNEDAQRTKKLLTGFTEEVLSIRSSAAKGEASSPSPRILEENQALKAENTQLEKDLAAVQKDLDSALEGGPPAGGAVPSKKTEPAPKGGEGGKTPEQEAEAQAGAGKKGEPKK